MRGEMENTSLMTRRRRTCERDDYKSSLNFKIKQLQPLIYQYTVLLQLYLTIINKISTVHGNVLPSY